ncbi:MAG TPA: sensor histidine kinase N-terminal domain-containing protein, partial [Rhodoferax sp.]
MNELQREQRSLFGEILDWMLTPLLLLWPVSLVLTWLVAQSIAGKPFDRALEYNARAMAQLIMVHNNRAEFNLPRPSRELLRANDSDTVYYQVVGSHHELLSGERDLPAPPTEENVTRDEVHIRDDVINGFDVKVAYIWVSLPIQGARPALVQVAETLEKRSMLATEIVKGVMLPQFVILPLAALLVWLALVQSIKPLSQL